jgi:hypothetical protein
MKRGLVRERRAELRTLAALVVWLLVFGFMSSPLAGAPAAGASAAGTWEAVTLPQTGLYLGGAGGGPEDNVFLNGILCPAETFCVTTGDYESDSQTLGSTQAMIETLSGAKWVPTMAPMAGLDPPASTFLGPFNDGFSGLSCPAPGSCVAVGSYVSFTSHIVPGQYTPSDGKFEGLIETLKGGTWTASTAPTSGLRLAAGNPWVDFGGQACPLGGRYTCAWGALSCPAVGWCVAVGSYNDASHQTEGLIETLSGGIWRGSEAPIDGLDAEPAANPHIDLEGVSCPAPGLCYSVGGYMDRSGRTDSLVETLSGGEWRPSSPTTASLFPAEGTGGAALRNVSCAARGHCVALGAYGASSGAGLGFAEVLSAGTWKASTVPTPVSPSVVEQPDYFMQFDSLSNDLSCPTISFCATIGSYLLPTDKSGARHPVVDILSGGTWTATNGPYADGIACSAPGACIADGPSALTCRTPSRSSRVVTGRPKLSLPVRSSRPPHQTPTSCWST